MSYLGNKYVQDPSDESNYIKCENKYSNCDTCNITYCSSCKNDFTFINGNKSSCYNKSDLYNKYIQDPSDPSNFIKCENKIKIVIHAIIIYAYLAKVILLLLIKIK